MNMQRLRALARKEWLHILRDSHSLIMAIATPLMLLGLFGYSLTFDVDHVPIAVWDQSQTPESRDLIAEFSGSRYFSLVPHPMESYHEVDKAIDKRDALVALVIPRRFGEYVSAGESADIQIVADGSDSNTATIALGYAESLTNGYAERLVGQRTEALGRSLHVPSVNLLSRIWYNPEAQSRNSIVPGLIAVIMMVVSALLTSLCVAREWEQGSMLQLLSTPIQVWEMLIGKLTPYFAIAMADVVLVVMLGEFVFHVPLRGSLLLLFAMAAIFCTGSLCFGLFISSTTKNQLLATQVAMMTTFLPSFLLSGFYGPISSMPYVIQWITYLVPARYFIALLRGIYLKGVGLEVLYPEAAILLLFTGTLVLLTYYTLKRSQV